MSGADAAMRRQTGGAGGTGGIDVDDSPPERPPRKKLYTDIDLKTSGKEGSPARPVSMKTILMQQESRKKLDEALQKESPSQVLFASAERDVSVALKELNNQESKLTSPEKDRLRSIVRKEAVARASRGEPIDKDIVSLLDSDALLEIKFLQDQYRESQTSAKGRFVTRKVFETADSALVGAGRVADASKEGDAIAASKEGHGGLLEQIDNIKLSPFFKDSAIIGDEERSAFAVRKDLPPDSLSGFMTGLSGIDFVQQKGPTHIERITREAESLDNNRGALARVDTSSYEEGVAAFNKGDREKLIESMTKLQGEQEKLKDRYYLVEQTRAEILNPRNRVSAYHEDGGLFGTFGSDGARKLSDATAKLNATKAAIKDSANKVQSRHAMLKYKLARLDAAVPGERSVPERIDVLPPGQRSKPEDFSHSLTSPVSFTKGVFKRDS
jgi:hypothetical protein